ncbi:hypothetical protein A3I80_01005 [Candidatus Gottesmanbacteria bacterium RIFCSPLOWO2_02_FULL_40_10]|nr:MAG: hypothetical protein A3I80_01005 [Candidatus Gottesmanbacteria bacterium RIFCSPLOWO2_02_FULL_40_10]
MKIRLKIYNSMRKTFLIKLFLSAIFFLPLFFVLTQSASAASPSYPVDELKKCRNVRECALYCQIPQNTPACWAYSHYVLQGRVLGVTTVTDDEKAGKAGITFPVKELGDCESIDDCRDYCSLEDNKETCRDYSIKKKIIKTTVRRISNTILTAARTELGCDSKTSCHNYCRQPENMDICRSFGEKHDLIKAVQAKSFHPEIWAKAKKELKCEDELSCKNFCSHPDNKKICAAFKTKYMAVQQISSKNSTILQELIRGGKCENEKECLSYCQKYPDDCPGFKDSKLSPDTAPGSVKTFLGPGGCKTEAECYQYCLANPDGCPAMPKKQGSNFGSLPATTPLKTTPAKATVSPGPADSPTPSLEETS